MWIGKMEERQVAVSREQRNAELRFRFRLPGKGTWKYNIEDLGTER